MGRLGSGFGTRIHTYASRQWSVPAHHDLIHHRSDVFEAPSLTPQPSGRCTVPFPRNRPWDRRPIPSRRADANHARKLPRRGFGTGQGTSPHPRDSCNCPLPCPFLQNIWLRVRRWSSAKRTAVSWLRPGIRSLRFSARMARNVASPSSIQSHLLPDQYRWATSCAITNGVCFHLAVPTRLKWGCAPICVPKCFRRHFLVSRQ